MATVAETTRSTKYTLASASAGPFLVGYRLFDDDAVEVYVNGTKRTDWTLSSTYANGYDDNASITFDAALAVSDVVIIETLLAPGRSDDYVAGDPSLTAKMNVELGRVWSTLADHDREIKRSLRVLDVAQDKMTPETGKALVFGADGKVGPGAVLDSAVSVSSWAETFLAASTAAAGRITLGLGDGAAVYATRTALAAADVHSGVNIVVTQGYSAAGDLGGATYKRVASEPSHAGKVQSNDGAWWEILPPVNVKAVGATGDGSTDDTTAIQGAIDAAPEGTTVLFPPATYKMGTVNITKALTLDLCYSDFTLIHGADLADSDPAFFFQGSLGTRRPISTPSTEFQDRVDVVTSGHAADFAAGDYVEILDSTTTLGWDETAITSVTIAGGGSGYTDGDFVRLEAATGSGVNASGTIAVTAGAVTGVTIVSGGEGFEIGNTVNIVHPQGTGTGATATVAGIDGGQSGSYGTRKEINRVKAISGSTIFLEKSIEWQYQNGNSATIAKITPLVKPRVVNGGTLSETNPGGSYTGSTVNGPHIFGFYLCVDPVVSQATVEGWQMHVCQFHMCMNPLIERVTARKAFRPTVGGHGYVVQFAQCTGGVARENRAYEARHCVDWTQCYDCISQNNAAFAPVGAQYVGHGQGAKRCKSIDDALYVGGGDRPLGWGWGNPSFYKDYDLDVIRPVVRGRADGTFSAVIFSNSSASERMRIIDPNVILFSDSTNTGYNKVLVTEQGAVDTLMMGGYIDISECDSSGSDGAVAAEANGQAPINLSVIGTTIIGPRSNNTSSIWVKELAGFLRIRDVSITSRETTHTGIRVNEGSLEEIEITGNHFYNGGARGIYTLSPATRRYRVYGNDFVNSFGTASQTLAASSLLIQGQNDTFLSEFTVAGLPAGRRGLLAYATNGRKAGETAGNGTGVPVFHDGSDWKAIDTGATVAA